MAAKVPAVVIDCGSGITKCGFAGDDDPTVFPTVVGWSSNKSTHSVGKPVFDAWDDYDVSHPVERGQITRWDDMEIVWKHAFDALKVEPSGHAVVLADSPTNSKESREKMVQVMFEKFNTAAAYLANQSVLALYANGRMTGLVLDSGHGVTHTVPVYEGYAVKENIRKLELGGSDVTSYLAKLVKQHGHSNSSPGSETRETQLIKEQHCSVAMDYKSECNTLGNKNYQLPDGRTIALSPEMAMCGELLYQPDMVTVDSPGVHSMVQDSIQSCEIDLRADLYKNVILAGGSTLFPGFTERMTNELTALHPAGVRVVSGQGRQIYSWTGGSIMASMDEFAKRIITKNEYAENGPSIVHTKCA